MRSHRTGIILGMTALAIAVRVLPYVFARFGLLSVNDFSMSLLSVAPIGAMCLFGGARHSNRWIGVGIPAAAWFATNLLIGQIMSDLEFYSMFRDQGVVMLGFLVTAALGATIPEKAPVWRIAVTALVAELAFFVLTNFGVWAMTNWYPHTAVGLVACYTAGLAFLGRGLVGMGVWGSLLFGVLAYVEKTVPSVSPSNSV
ncbi:MAG: hypothetical protein NT069_16635 [Planctomycetota bacterium]|nr:hypothetical protein [Planctomycetota bacterium]